VSECRLYNTHKYPKGFKVYNKSKYSDARDSEWTKMVLERDSYTCQECGSTEDLVAHHIIPISEDYTQSADYDNGVCLCQNCHKKKHSEITGCGYQELGSLCR